MAENKKEDPRKTTEEEFQKYLEDLAPFLKLGETLYAALDDAGMLNHQTVIYEKYRLKDWFAQKVDAYRAYPGKLANNVLVKIVMDVSEAIKQDRSVSENQMKNVRFFAEKSRSAQPYFVNRTENADAKPIDDLLDNMEAKGEEGLENDVAGEIKKQVVEAKPPIQNQEQTGQASDVQPQPDAAQAPA